MEHKIAVLLNEEGHLTSFIEATLICIYEKTSQWQVIQTIELKDLSYKRENDTKNFTLALIENLRGCKVIVGTLILGVPYYLLIRSGYEVCEAASFSILLLEQIYEDYCKPFLPNADVVDQETALVNEGKADSIPIMNISKSPVPIDEAGNFFIDIIAVQKAYPEISSKKILLPFLSNTLFNSLKINCSHVMPWLENYLEQRHFMTHISKRQGSYIVLITHSLCSC